MQAPLSSPDRRTESVATRRITYSGGKKRKRILSNPHADSDSDSSSACKSIKSAKMSTPSPRTADPKPSSKRGPKKVDVNLPGPSPIKRDADESVKPSKPSRSRHRTAASMSASSLKDVAQQIAESPSFHKKPEFTETNNADPTVVATPKPKSRAKSIAADEDFDDNASIAESTISVTKTRRNEAERIEYYKNQPECGILEPHAAQCTRCDKIVNLGRRQTYAVRPWELHRIRCDQKPAKATLSKPAPTTPAPTQQSPASQLLDMPAPIMASSSHPAPTPTPARRPSEQDRKKFLESEKQIKQLEKNRALCAKCDQWIALSEATAYTSGNWMKHKVKCFDAVPSNRVAAAKRKLLLVNDRQAKTFTTNSVDCNNCGVSVALVGEGDFNLTAWDAHKGQCTKSIPIPRNESVNSLTFPSRSLGAPVSSGPSACADTAVAGVKRSREEVDATPEDEQTAVRPRTATYLPPQIEPPSTLLGWFMLPFSSFARGFKESLKDRS